MHQVSASQIRLHENSERVQGRAAAGRGEAFGASGHALAQAERSYLQKDGVEHSRCNMHRTDAVCISVVRSPEA